MSYADYILKSSAIFTATQEKPISGAVAVAGEQILAVGTADALEQYRGPETNVLELGDRLVMPGFNDAHMHFSLSAVQNDPDFCIFMVGLPGEDACVKAVEEFARSHPDNPWIYGWGWYADTWDEPHMPSRATLDAIGVDRPVCLSSFDLHTVWCNGAALKKMGITRDTPQPFGGEIGLDENGEPNGLLKELPANKKMMDEALNVPGLKNSLRKALADFRALGITAAADVYPAGVTNNDILDIIHGMEESGELTCRISCFPDMKDLKTAEKWRACYQSDLLHVSGVKQILDGVVEAHTACLKTPYEDRPAECGEAMMTQDELNGYVLEAARAGFSCKLHTIGNGAVEMALNAYEKARTELGDRGLRHSLEHTETIDGDEIRRMAELNVLAAVQPIHTALGFCGGGYQPCLGEERSAKLWPFRDMLDAGVKLAFSTDAPAAYSINPLWNVYSAVTRSEPDHGEPPEGCHREQAVTLAEALTAYTRTSAYAESVEGRVGTLEAGMLADMVVIDRNLFATHPMDIRFAQVDMTMLGGQIIYQRV